MIKKKLKIKNKIFQLTNNKNKLLKIKLVNKFHKIKNKIFKTN